MARSSLLLLPLALLFQACSSAQLPVSSLSAIDAKLSQLPLFSASQNEPQGDPRMRAVMESVGSQMHPSLRQSLLGDPSASLLRLPTLEHSVASLQAVRSDILTLPVSENTLTQMGMSAPDAQRIMPVHADGNLLTALGSAPVLLLPTKQAVGSHVHQQQPASDAKEAARCMRKHKWNEKYLGTQTPVRVWHLTDCEQDDNDRAPLNGILRGRFRTAISGVHTQRHANTEIDSKIVQGVAASRDLLFALSGQGRVPQGQRQGVDPVPSGSWANPRVLLQVEAVPGCVCTATRDDDGEVKWPHEALRHKSLVQSISGSTSIDHCDSLFRAAPTTTEPSRPLLPRGQALQQQAVGTSAWRDEWLFRRPQLQLRVVAALLLIDQ
ncbi:MAG: hypothetical protein MHM6MM_005931, partial [Cercozoa sp. M6MM]